MRQRRSVGRFWAHARKSQPPPLPHPDASRLRKSIPEASSTAQRHNPCPVPSELDSSADPRLPMIEGDVLGRCPSLTIDHAAKATPRRLNYRFCVLTEPRDIAAAQRARHALPQTRLLTGMSCSAGVGTAESGHLVPNRSPTERSYRETAGPCQAGRTATAFRICSPLRCIS